MVDWAGTVVATTRRLVLRTFRADDLPRYAALNADPLVVRHLGGRPFGREYSDGIAEWAQESFARQGFGLLAVERRSDGAFLGMCGLHRHSSHQEEVEVAWRFASQSWGNGYATEAATGWMDHGFHDLALDHVISMTDEPNRPSQAVMHRLGMVYDRDIEIVEDGERINTLVHVVAADDWRTRRVGVDRCTAAICHPRGGQSTTAGSSPKAR